MSQSIPLVPGKRNRVVVQVADGWSPTQGDWETMLRQFVSESNVVVYFTTDPVSNVSVTPLKTRPSGMQSIPYQTPQVTNDQPSRFFAVDFDYYGERYTAKAPGWIGFGPLIAYSNTGLGSAVIIGYQSPQEIAKEQTVPEKLESGIKWGAILIGAAIAAYGIGQIARFRGRG